MRKFHLAIITAIAGLSAQGVSHAEDIDPAHLSLVAGYKAAFTCSAHFNAGRSVEQIAGDELNRIYPNYREAFASLPDAVIDERAKSVSVNYKEGHPPRVASWRPHLGCGQFPTWAGLDGVPMRLPTVSPRMTKDLPRPLPEKLSEDDALIAAVDAAFDRATYGEGTETTAVIVLKDGAIIAEKYRDGFGPDVPQRTWSVAKSIAATIIGAAVEENVIDLGQRTGMPRWDAPGDPRRRITFDDLIHMASGLDAGPAGNRTDNIYFGGGRVFDHATARRLIAEPGARWYYANNDTMLMMRALRVQMDDDTAYLRFPFENVLHPIGMRRTFLETDWGGDFILSSQVWTTARDLARLGLLYLNDGVWEGRRIVPEGWANFVAAPIGPQPPQRREGETPPGYGAQFWVYDTRHGLPNGTYAARGNRGQYLFIVPERNVLVIRRGFDDNGGARFDVVSFTRDILQTLE